MHDLSGWIVLPCRHELAGALRNRQLPQHGRWHGAERLHALPCWHCMPSWRYECDNMLTRQHHGLRWPRHVRSMRRWHLSVSRGPISLRRVHTWPLLRRGRECGAAVRARQLLERDKSHECHPVLGLPPWLRMRHRRHSADGLQSWKLRGHVIVWSMHAVLSRIVSGRFASHCVQSVRSW